MAHVFISFVEENAKVAAWIADQLRANGLEPWFSKDPGRIMAGDQWRETLRTAIREGGFYLPLFTKEWARRQRTVANEELTVALEEARLRGLHRRWFIPAKLDEEPLPQIDLGAGVALSSLHYVDFPQLGWERGLRVLLAALGVDRPVLEQGEPLAPGFGSTAEITGGYVTYRNMRPPVPEMEGMTFTVTGGWVRRNATGTIIGNFRLRAPYEGHQQINEQLGLDDIDVRAIGATISIDERAPTRFEYVDKKDVMRPGTPLWQIGSPRPVLTQVPVEQETGYVAHGYLNPRDRVVGNFEGYVASESPIGRVKVVFDGDFELAVRPIVAPPA